MKRRSATGTVLVFVLAALAAVVAATGVVKGDSADFAWGVAAALGLGGVFLWFTQRGD